MVAYKWTVLSNTTLGALLASLDGTIVLISLPVIFHGLGVDPFDPRSFPLLLWILLGYGVVTGTLLPPRTRSTRTPTVRWRSNGRTSTRCASSWGGCSSPSASW